MTAQAEKTFSPEGLSAAACAEAAAWIARLHGNERTTEVEQGFRRWLDASAEHRAAFELANELWTDTERWPRPATPTFVPWPRAGVVLTVPRALVAATVVAALALLGSMFYLREPGLVTQIGEQRNITLEDGTRVSLNTATRIRVDYDEKLRRVQLETGEALFEVAKRADRPFVVTAGERQITALGTAFIVRRDNDEIAVTLVEGKVAVAPLREPSGEKVEAKLEATVLSPGERLRFASGASPKLDRPALAQVMAWERGQVMLDHTPLYEAIEEMNRYSIVQLAIDDSAVANLEVTGVFRSGDSVSFAQAVAENYGLEIVNEPRRIRLTGIREGPQQ